MTLTEFLLDRIAGDEEVARALDAELAKDFGSTEAQLYSPLSLVGTGYMDYPAISIDSTRVLAECEAKRRIVELHKSWPVLVETEPVFEQAAGDDINSMTMRMSKQIQWQTEQEYRTKFGAEPPTAPILRALASVYADHPDFREEWRS